MANIDRYLNKILEAKFGEEVRGSIHDAISEINKENVIAKNKIDNMTVSAVALNPGNSPTATITDNGSQKSIRFGIPKGDKGEKGDRGFGETGYNLLVNSDFRNPVNQRGKIGSNIPAGYTLDRWYTWAATTITVSPGKYTNVTGTSLNQYLNEPYNRGVLTLVVKIYGIANPLICTYDTSKIGAARDGAAAIIRNENSLCASLDPDHSYEWAALYEGTYTRDNWPAYVPKGYPAEWMECQRYYRTVYRTFGTSIGNLSREVILFSVPTRVAPTVTVLNLWKGSEQASCTINAVTTTYVDVSYVGWGNVTLAIDAET